MNCNICLKALKKTDGPPFHKVCIKRLFPGLKGSPRLPIKESEFGVEARKVLRSKRFSISGVQQKIGLVIIDGQLELAAEGSSYIAKPTPRDYPRLTEVEHLTMELCRLHDPSVAACGLVPYRTGVANCYVTRRYDRDVTNGDKRHQEDLQGAMGIVNTDEDAKYGLSYQACLDFLMQHFGPRPAQHLLHRLILMYYLGNSDFHLKNISIFPHEGGELTPIYDAINTDVYDLPDFLALDLFADDREYDHLYGYPLGYDFLVLCTEVGLEYEAALSFIEALVGKHDKARKLIEHSMLPKKTKSLFAETLDRRLRALTTIDPAKTYRTE
ncbi:HipA domain-containing protein [Microbulbifer aggregans]|uniref:HipA domain-containing protein n=1 Tax=Microbulbifer aggregans TaxID=1769779 RepID=UPI001CFC4DC0|nr:HipA domain-containing protein [Microbulbifer aggregans]